MIRKSTSKQDVFPRGLNAHNLKLIVLILLPIILLLQLPSLLQFKSCVDSGRLPCEGSTGVPVIVLAYILPLFILIVLKFRKHLPWSEFGLNKPTSSQKQTRMLLGIGAILIIGLNVVISLFAQHVPALREQQFVFSPGENLLPFAIFAVIFAPIIEELFFRGFEFAIAARRFGAIVGAVLSSASFGIVHGQIVAGIFTAIFGLYLCFLYYKTRSLLPGIGLHAFNNILAVAAMILFK